MRRPAVFVVLTLLAACVRPQTAAPIVLTEGPADAFVRYWETRLEERPNQGTWREFCLALDQWPILYTRHVKRLDHAMHAWPDEWRRVPDRWKAFDAPVRFAGWPLVRAVEIGSDDVLTGHMPHLDTVTWATIDGATAVSAVATTTALPHLASVQVLATDIPSLRELVSRRGAKLVRVDVWENDLGPQLADVLRSRSWPHLVGLDVGANRLDAASADALAALEAPVLAELVVGFNPLGDEGLSRLAATPRNLSAFDARATGISGASIEALTALGTARLESLDLSDNDLGDIAIAALARLPLARLRSLRLNHVGVTRVGVLALSAMLGGGLEVLELSRNELGDDGVKPLCAPGAAGLRYLEIDAVRLGNDAARSLARCPHLWGLHALSVENNSGLDPAGVEELAGAPFRELHAIGLDGCGIGDAGLAVLVQASWWPRLTHVQLEGNALTDTSAPLLGALPAGVQNLGLGWNEFGPAAAAALANAALPKLEVLSLPGNAFDDGALRSLVEAPWLGQLSEIDLRALAFDGLSLSLDAIAARLPDHATLRREQ